MKYKYENYNNDIYNSIVKSKNPVFMLFKIDFTETIVNTGFPDFADEKYFNRFKSGHQHYNLSRKRKWKVGERLYNGLSSIFLFYPQDC